MKLIIALSIEEHAAMLTQLFRQYNVDIYSETSIEGFKHPDGTSNAGNWFVARPDGVFSHLVFAFTEDHKSHELLEGIRMHNQKEHLLNPIHAFQMSVEDHT